MRNTIKHGRFKGVEWYPKEDTYTLVGGAGGIGSWLTMLLSRAGFKPVVFDFDTLEEHNMSGQLYSKHMIGLPKVEALKKVVSDYCSQELMVFNEVVTDETFSHAITFSAFDNMKARRALFTSWKQNFHTDPKAIFIDGRLTAEQMQIFCVIGGDTRALEEYDYEHLFNDSMVEDAPCTVRQTSHAAAMIASHMVGFLTNHITNVYNGEQMRPVPFNWEYFIPLDFLTVKNHSDYALNRSLQGQI